MNSEQAISYIQSLFDKELPNFNLMEMKDDGLRYFYVTCVYKNIWVRIGAEKNCLEYTIKIDDINTGPHYLKKNNPEDGFTSKALTLNKKNIEYKFSEMKDFINSYTSGKMETLPTLKSWKKLNKDFIEKYSAKRE